MNRSRVKKLLRFPVQGMLKAKAHIMGKRDKICRSIWRGAEQREKKADWLRPGLSVREGKTAGTRGREEMLAP